MKRLLIVLMVLLLISCSNENETKESMINSPSQSNGIEAIVFESDTIDEFYDELFVRIMNENPQYIDALGDLSEYGVPFQKGQLTSVGEEQALKMISFYKGALEKLEDFEEDDINYKNVKWYLEIELQQLEFRNHIFFLSHIIGEQRGLYNLLIDTHIIENKEDAENWIERVKASEKSISEWIERYTYQANNGYLMDPYTIDSVIGQIRTYYKSKTEHMDLFNVFSMRVDALNISADDKRLLLDDAVEALENYYVPNMEALKQVLYDSKSVSSKSNGVWALPNGDAYYEFALKRHTTTDMTPEEIHQLGLKEVERIQKEMSDAFQELGYEGSLIDNMNALYNDATPYRGQAAMDEYVRVASIMEEGLSQFFYEEDLPVSSPNIKVSPGGNFYVSPSIDGKRAGVYYLDLNGTHYDFAINTLAFHETVPGHHLEREHQLVLDDIPMIRKLAFNTAYIEGWALYAEMLADENGYNPTPAHHIGYLKSELHRAARLVVDTGIHYKRWDRAQAVNYLVDEGLLHPSYAQVEVTRYTSWPGQACAYKIGQLKILELREFVEQTKGSDFDIKAFHHMILGNGSMPLTILEEYVKTTIK